MIKDNSYISIGRYVVFYTSFIIVFTLTLWILGWLSFSQLIKLITLLISLKSLYVTTFIKYLISSRDAELVSQNKYEIEKYPQKNILLKYARWLFIFEYIGLTLGILLSGLSQDILSFEQLLTFWIPVWESFFGILTGLIVSEVFKV